MVKSLPWLLMLKDHRLALERLRLMVRVVDQGLFTQREVLTIALRSTKCQVMVLKLSELLNNQLI
jgi:hypothetical protein